MSTPDEQPRRPDQPADGARATRPRPRAVRRTAARTRGLIAVAAVGAVVVAVVAVHDVEASSSRPRLSVPRSLDHGRYTLTRDTSSDSDGGLDSDRKAPGMHAMTGVSGSYRRAPDSARHDLLDFDGDYGTVDDPARAVAGLLTWMQDSGEGSVAVPARTLTPHGAGAPLTCEVVKSTATGATPAYLPMCAWADSRTVAAVAETDYGHLAASPGAVDLIAFAVRADTVRTEVSAH